MALTRIYQAAPGMWVKRDDEFLAAGAPGGKARTCYALATKDPHTKGLITAGAHASPQVHIVARVGHELGLPVRVHVPASKEPSMETRAAAYLGATVVTHRPGYNSVIVARAQQDALEHPGWTHIPFGMECDEAVKQTASQVPFALPVRRIVVPVGSGMSMAGIVAGLRATQQQHIEVLGVMVGADPLKRLKRYAPTLFYPTAQVWSLAAAGSSYHEAKALNWHGIDLDPHYEAKAAGFVKPGDLLWIVGHRPPSPAGMPR